MDSRGTRATLQFNTMPIQFIILQSYQKPSAFAYPRGALCSRTLLYTYQVFVLISWQGGRFASLSVASLSEGAKIWNPGHVLIDVMSLRCEL